MRLIRNQRLALEMERARNPFLWLIFLILAGVVTTVLILKNLIFVVPFVEDRLKFDVAFDTVKGVTDQHPVEIAGVEVGRVDATAIENGEGVLTLSLEPQYGPVYRDATVSLRTRTALEDYFVTIEDRGTPAAGEVTPTSPPIASEQTIEPVQVNRVLNVLEPEVRSHLNILLHELAKGLAGNGDDLKRAFAEVVPFLDSAGKVSAVMAEREDKMRRVISNFADLSDELAERDDQLNTLISAGNETVTSLASSAGPLQQTIAELPPTMTTIRDSFQRLRVAEDALDPALVDLLPAANELESGLAGLQRFSEDAIPAFQALRPTAREVRPLARQLAPTSRSLEGAVEGLLPQAPRADKLTAELDRCQDSLQGFFQDTLSVTKFGNAFGAAPRSNVSQGNSSLQVVGGGDNALGGGEIDLFPHELCTTGETYNDTRPPPSPNVIGAP